MMYINPIKIYESEFWRFYMDDITIADNRLKCVFLITGMMMGGAERVLSTIANEMAARGHQITLISLKPDASAYPLNSKIEFICSDCKITNSNYLIKIIQMCASAIKGLNKYRSIVKEKQPDVVLAFLTNSNFLALICKKLYFRHIPLVVSERADPCARKSKLIKFMITWLYPQADCIVCQGSKVAAYFKSVNEKSKINIIPNPIDADCICQNTPVKRNKKIVAIGRLCKQKNYDLLIESFYEFHRIYDEYEVEIYGQGPEEKRLREKVKILGLEDKVHFMGVMDRVMRQANNASLYIMTSDFEGFPNALLEAMASGLPVICTDFPTGTACDVIINGVNGYIVPMNDRKRLTEAMIKILNNSDDLEKMGQNARQIYHRYNTKTIVNQWENLFFELKNMIYRTYDC